MGILWLLIVLILVSFKVAFEVVSQRNDDQLFFRLDRSNLIVWGVAPVILSFIIPLIFIIKPRLTGNTLYFLGYGGKLPVLVNAVDDVTKTFGEGNQEDTKSEFKKALKAEAEDKKQKLNEIIGRELGIKISQKEKLSGDATANLYYLRKVSAKLVLLTVSGAYVEIDERFYHVPRTKLTWIHPRKSNL